MEILSLPENEPFITGIEESIDICFNQIMKLADASIFHCRSGKAHIEIDLQAYEVTENTQLLLLPGSIIIRKTKCFDFWERNVLFPKTKRSFFRTPKHPLPCPFPLNFPLLIITKKFGNLAKNRYICIV